MDSVRRSPRVVSVRHGRVHPQGSWLYVWIDIDTGAIAYVGGTGFDPELRAHLHLEGTSPEFARVRATVPEYDRRDFDVLAFELPAGIERSDAKADLIACLAGVVHGEDGTALRDITEPMARAVDAYRARIEGPVPPTGEEPLRPV